MAILPELKGVHLGSRDGTFTELIRTILIKGKLIAKYVEVLLSPESLEEYSKAFTSDQLDPNNNYQVYEQLGDGVGGLFFVDYFYIRFPQLNCAEGVKVVARLKINYGSKNTFSKIAECLGFWNFISAPNDLRQRKKKSLLEDVFEAFLGVTFKLSNEKIAHGIGFQCSYNILKRIFNDMNISLKYEDLYDAKTRLKELFDLPSYQEMGPVKYEETRNNLLTSSRVFIVDKIKGKKIVLGEGKAAIKPEAEQIASAKALEILRRKGIQKFVPSFYLSFCEKDEKSEKEITKEEILETLKGADINAQFPTIHKTKYQNKYTSSLLGKYCRDRNLSGIKMCLKLKADSNSLDSDGMSCFDLLLIGTKLLKIYVKIAKKFFTKVDIILVHENVLAFYFPECPKEILEKLSFLQD